MLSSRSKKSLAGHAIVIVAAVVAWRCAEMQPRPTPTAADHNSFQNERKNMRQRLMGQTGDSGVVIDENAILIGVVDNPNGSSNATRDPSEMHVKQGKFPKLTWVCWDGRFTLKFISRDGQESPLEQKQTEIKGGDSTPSVASAVVRSDAPIGRYYFSIRVDLADGGTYNDTACPPIIIE